MAYVAPTTRADGYVVDASEWNKNTVDNVAYFKGSPSFDGIVTAAAQPRCKAYKTGAAQSIPDATETAVTFDAETFDVGAMHDNAVNPSRLTIPASADGLYLIVAGISMAANATGARALTLKKNGVAFANVQQSAVAAATQIMQISGVMTAAAADYFEVFVTQNSTGALNVNLGESVTYISAVKVW